MASVNRQNNLFAAEDWKVAYKAFSQVDFQAYDFDTIRTTLVDYIRTNFPENFNDYTESSEFIAILELLAFLSTSIAFRMDVNTRENFLETAERRDSVFKLARMLGYNPKRNITASGLMKLSAVTTTEPLTDSQGNQLSNTKVFWDDANNPDSYEQFITILNSAMSSTNRFTAPVKTGKVANINTEKYHLNTTIGSPISYSFSINANGVNRTCEIVNGDFLDGKYFYEQEPNPVNDFGIFYRNDGQGVASNNTGFFLLFKQGDLQFEDFNFTTPVVNGLSVFDHMKQVGEAGGVYAQFMSKATFMIPTPRLLDQVVQMIDGINMEDRDTKGDLYEYMLGKIASAGTNGQFRTPRHIIKMMVEMAQPGKEETICDPSAGSAGFLVTAGEYYREHHEDWFLDKDFRDHFNSEMFNGVELDETMARIGAMNLA